MNADCASAEAIGVGPLLDDALKCLHDIVDADDGGSGDEIELAIDAGRSLLKSINYKGLSPRRRRSGVKVPTPLTPGNLRRLIHSLRDAGVDVASMNLTVGVDELSAEHKAVADEMSWRVQLKHDVRTDDHTLDAWSLKCGG